MGGIWTFCEVRDRKKNGVTHWVRDTSKIDEAVECSGYFALRSNAVTDAFEALSIYRQRNMVEQDFYQLKNWLDGDRLHVGAVSVCSATLGWGAKFGSDDFELKGHLLSMVV